MNALAQWGTYGLPSLVVGIFVGHFTAQRAVIKALDRDREVAMKPKWSTWRKVGIGALALYILGLTAYGAIQVTNSNDGIRDLANCTTGVLTKITESLDESAALTSQVSAAARVNTQAQADLATATVAVLTRSLAASSSGQHIPQDEARQLVQDWLDATTAAQKAADDYVTLSKRLSEVRREHPVPSVDEIEACR